MNSAIIVAGGIGSRMNSAINKQYLRINDKPMLYYSLHAFSKHNLIDEIILVVPKGEINYCKKEILENYNIEKVKLVVEGGAERQDSVLNGLKALKNCDIVLIHDGARPFVESRLIDDGIKYAKEYGACACGMPVKDTIKILGEHGLSDGTLDRSKLFVVQTPQCFNYNIIFDGHNKILKENVCVTDDTAIVERYGHKVYLYSGSYNNIKITTQEDMLIANEIVKKFGDVTKLIS